MAKNDREGLMKLDQAIRETEWHEAHVAASRECITDLQRIFKFLVDEKNVLYTNIIVLFLNKKNIFELFFVYLEIKRTWRRIVR